MAACAAVRLSKAAAQARGHGLCPVALQPHVALVCHFTISGYCELTALAIKLLS